MVPTRVDMIKPSGVSEVCPVKGKLVKSVQLRLHGIITRPWITAAALKHEHTVIDGRAVEWAEGINFGRWGI